MEAILPVVRSAVREAGVALGDIGAVAVGHRPGLVGSLLVGVSAAKGLAWSLGVPLVGVDHVHAHLYAGLLESDAATERRRDGGGSGRGASPGGADQGVFPALGLVVSGGHTSLYVMRSPIEMKRVGATIDDALGEAFDKAATVLGLGHPGGPNLDMLAASEGANDRAVKLPISRLSRDSLDMSFSGLKTALLYAVRGMPGRGTHGPQGYERRSEDLGDDERRDLAASFQRAAIDAVMLKLCRALERFEDLAGEPCRAVLTGGGVTANSLLRARLVALGEERGVPVVLPRMSLCVDNAAMIAGLGHELLRSGRVSDMTLAPVPTTAC
ncbi:MAG: tRNA (adenosine(37)-N6)-threonylcarbamoyltransferase complex transferase subunit TsaD [Phycisphaerales bacterium JB041]